MLRIALAAAGAAAFVACGSASSPATGPDVLLISIDALRAGLRALGGLLDEPQTP